MDAISEYIISVTSAALVCGCVKSIFDNKSAISSVIKMLCGIFLSMVALHPLIQIDLSNIADISFLQTVNTETIIVDAEQMAADQQRTFISQKCQTYIAQKARELGCNLDIQVSTDEEAPYAPNGVKISGSISPYARGQLTNWINDNLAISAEDQTWIG